MWNISKINIFGSLREIRRPAKLEKRKHRALRRVAMERVFGLRGRCCSRGRPRHSLGVGGATKSE
jgi:hypothetical protein